MNYVIMPVLAGPEMTESAIADVLAQSVECRLLVVNQGVDDAFRDRLERIAEQHEERMLVWHHEPRLLSLGATWNRALDFVWESGGTEALVVNNDVRLHPRTYEGLLGCLNVSENLFVTAVGVTPDDFETAEHPLYWYDYAKREIVSKGGPDFSCYLIAKACHQRFRFDENFVPAFCEDLDYHRTLMLAGEGQRIFSVNLPYLHLSSQTLKQVDPQTKMKIERQIEQGSRAYYARKWGGAVNQETFYRPFALDRVFMGKPEDLAAAELWAARCGPTTPEIQAWVQKPSKPIDELCKEMLDK